jgi:four helix bundle protein
MGKQMSEVRSYRDLLVWQKSMDLTMLSYQTVESFPSYEKFGLISTIRRVASLIPSTIADGHGKGITGPYLGCLSSAHGSLMLLETQFLIAERLSYIDAQTTQNLLQHTAEVGKMLHGLMRSLRAYESGN